MNAVLGELVQLGIGVMLGMIIEQIRGKASQRRRTQRRARYRRNARDRDPKSDLED